MTNWWAGEDNFSATTGLSAASSPTPGAQVITIGELNQRVRASLERTFSLQWIAGEVSNFTRAASGHWYFSLKDERAQARCVMFRHRSTLQGWQPSDGMAVEVRALVSLYEARGEFQLSVETMRRAGLGVLYERFAQLKAKLEREGLFDRARKRALPRFPRAVGIVTSPAAAALHDVLTVLRRRMPALPILLYPAQVQGAGASSTLVQAITQASIRADCDVLIVCRGGGSIEDLWPFNEESVARAIAACRVPVISGVGHETDFTIADFVADARAPTPTGAAQLAVADRRELGEALEQLRTRLARCLWRALESRMQALDQLSRRLKHPREQLKRRRAECAQLALRLSHAALQRLTLARWRLAALRQRGQAAQPQPKRLARELAGIARRLQRAAITQGAERGQTLAAITAHLQHLDPNAVLARGYALVARADGELVRDANDLMVGDPLALEFAKGRANAVVTDKSG